jgi:hypothetical protein
LIREPAIELRITHQKLFLEAWLNVRKKTFYTLCTFVLRHLGSGTKWFCWRRSSAEWIGRSKPGSELSDAGAEHGTTDWFRYTADGFG